MEIVHEVHFGLQEIPGVPRSMMKPLLGLMGETALGLCDVAVVEHRPPAPLTGAVYPKP
jgi:hypothetical protein